MYPPPGNYAQPNWQTPATDVLTSRIAPRVWVTTDYLLGFARSMPNRQGAIVTSGPPATRGVPGTVGTLVRHSTTDFGFDSISGFRISGGAFRDDARRYGWYASGFLMENKSDLFTAMSDPTGQPLLARPFINAQTGAADALLVSFPTFASGTITAVASSQIWGAEGGPIINLYRSAPCDDACIWNLNLTTGFRFLQLNETFRVSQFSTILPGQTAPFDGKLYGEGTQIEVTDEINALNQFYGGTLGLSTDLWWGRWQLSTTGKVGIGVMSQRLDINGWSIATQAAPLNVSTVPGGLVANATNIGRYRNDEFAVIPEVNMNLGYNWSSWLTTHIGYNFLYINRVIRPSEQYSPVVNTSLIPTSASYGVGGLVATPNPLFTQNEYWLQTVNFGFTVRY